jgi:multicomponent Na+:H+ antiporter subunit C
MTRILGLWNYWFVIIVMMMGKVRGGTAPIIPEDSGEVVYSNPLPHVLMLTAIVVGVATTALALGLVVRVHEEYGTEEEDEIVALDKAEADESRP